MKQYITISNVSNFPIEQEGLLTGKIQARIYKPKLNSELTSANAFIKYYLIVKNTINLGDGVGDFNQDVYHFIKSSSIIMNKADLNSLSNININSIYDLAKTKSLTNAWGLSLKDWKEVI